MSSDWKSARPYRALLFRVFIIIGLASTLVFAPVRAAFGYDDHGKVYTVPATYRWKQEWMDAKRHVRSAWQEGQASYVRKPAISVCVTYYAAPYQACEGDFVDWYWGRVGRRSGYLTDIDVDHPGHKHKLYGLFRKISRSADLIHGFHRASKSRAPYLTAFGPFPGAEGGWGGGAARQSGTTSPDLLRVLAHSPPLWRVRAATLRRTASTSVGSIFEATGTGGACVLARLTHDRGVVMGCSPSWTARSKGVFLTLDATNSNSVVGVLPSGTRGWLTTTEGNRTFIRNSASGGFAVTIRTHLYGVIVKRGRRVQSLRLR